MADQRSIDDALAAVLAAANSLELPVTVEYDRYIGLDGRTRLIRAKLLDENGVLLAELHDMRVEDELGHETAVDRQAEEMAILLNDAPLIAATLRDERISRDADIARAIEEVDSSLAAYINRDLASDALHILEAVVQLGAPANEETIHHVKVVCADGETRAALDAIAALLPRLRKAVEIADLPPWPRVAIPVWCRPDAAQVLRGGR